MPLRSGADIDDDIVRKVAGKAKVNGKDVSFLEKVGKAGDEKYISDADL